MLIKENSAVFIEYTVTDLKGNLIDSTENEKPLAFIQGASQLIPGLEVQMLGKAKGDQFSICIEPDDAYGQRDDNLLHSVPLEKLKYIEDLSPDMHIHAETEDGEGRILTVVHISEDEVLLDANHPLAGMSLNFDVKIIDVRDATREELEHGHVHESLGACDEVEESHSGFDIKIKSDPEENVTDQRKGNYLH